MRRAFRAMAPERRRDIRPAPRPLMPIKPIKVITIGRIINVFNFIARIIGRSILFNLVRAGKEKILFIYFFLIFYKDIENSLKFVMVR